MSNSTLHFLWVILQLSNNTAKHLEVNNLLKLSCLKYMKICRMVSLKIPTKLVNYKIFSLTEDIIKRRLLIDGDGTGDDRRLNMLLKHFLKWTYSKNDTPENK